MFDSPNPKRIGVLALVALFVVGTANPAAAALTYDNETTNSASVSDLVGGEVVTQLDNASKYKTIQVISDNATTSGLTNPEEAFTLKLTVNDSDVPNDGRTFYVNDSTAKVVNASAGHYAFNVSHAEMFDELERKIDQDVNVDVTVIFNESETDEEKSTITITARNGDKRSVDVITSEEMNKTDDVGIKSEDSFLGSNFSYAHVSNERQITNNTTISLVFANDKIASKFTKAYDVQSFSAGDYMYSTTASLEGHHFQVFVSQAGEKRDGGWFGGGFDPASDTYGVYHQNGGDHGDLQQLDIHPGDSYSNEKSVEYTVNGYKSLGFWANWQNFGSSAARTAGSGHNPA